MRLVGESHLHIITRAFRDGFVVNTDTFFILQSEVRNNIFRHLPRKDAIRLRIMERLHGLSEGLTQHTIAPEMRTKVDRLTYRFLPL